MRHKNSAILLINFLFLTSALAMEKDQFDEDKPSNNKMSSAILSGWFSTCVSLSNDAPYGQAFASGVAAGNLCGYTLSILEDEDEYFQERFIGGIVFGLSASGICYLCDAPFEWSVATGMTLTNFLQWYVRKHSSLLKKNIAMRYVHEKENKKSLEKQQDEVERRKEIQEKKEEKAHRREEQKKLKEQRRDENRKNLRPTITQIKYRREQLIKNLESLLATREQNIQKAAIKRQNKKQAACVQKQEVVVEWLESAIAEDYEQEKKQKKKTRRPADPTKTRKYHKPLKSPVPDVLNQEVDEEFITIVLKPKAKKLIANLFEVGSRNSVDDLRKIYKALGLGITQGPHRNISQQNMRSVTLSGALIDDAQYYQIKDAKEILNIFGITKNTVENW